MKKVIYYFSPFIIVPFLFLIFTLLEDTAFLEAIVPYVLFAAVFIFAFVIGVFSSSKTKFDYIMTVIVPISVLVCLFIFLFFDEGCDGGPQLSLHHALNMEYYKVWLPIALIMMVITFISSFKPIRNIVKKIFVRKT